MPKLIHTQDGHFQGEIELQVGNLLIGRHPDCDISLDDAAVSARHVLLSIRPSAYMEGLLDIHIEDQGSTNGTLVNGRPLQKRHMMKHNEVAYIGSHEFQLIDEGTRAFETTTIILPES